MRAVVTGGSGFIGSHLVEYLLSLGYQVWNVSKLTYAVNPRCLRHLDSNGNYHYLAIDILRTDDLRRLLNAEGIERVYHLAAETHVDRSFTDPQAFFLNNAYGTWSVLEAVRCADVKPKVYYMSTDEVFGNVEGRYCSETDSVAPRNPYSASKAAGENLCFSYFHSFGLPVVVGRSMNNFGPRQHPEKLIGKIISNCLLDRHYTLFEGNSIRGWIYVKDSSRAIELIMEKGVAGQIYHVPPSDYLTVAEVNAKLLEITGCKNCFSGFKGTRLKDDERYALSAEKMRHDLGFRNQYSFDQGLKETVDWWKQNVWFWKN